MSRLKVAVTAVSTDTDVALAAGTIVVHAGRVVVTW